MLADLLNSITACIETCLLRIQNSSIVRLVFSTINLDYDAVDVTVLLNGKRYNYQQQQQIMKSTLKTL